MKRVLLLVVVVVLIAFGAAAEETMTNEDVIKLVSAGLTQDTIETKIFNSDTRFDTGTDAIIELTQRGIPDRVIRAMIARQAEQRGSSAPAPRYSSSSPSRRRLFDVSIHRTRTSRCDTGELRMDGAGMHARGCRPTDFDLYWNEIESLCYSYGSRGVIEFKTSKRKWRISTTTPAEAREIVSAIAEMRPEVRRIEGCP